MTAVYNSFLTRKASYTGLFVLLVLIATLTGCGSTKVYTADKTLLVHDSLYNLASVQKISSSVEIVSPNGDGIDPMLFDKKQAKLLLKQYDTLTVTTNLLLDDTVIVYEKQRIDSYSDYSRMTKRHGKAVGELNKFMSDAKKTQLKLD